MGYLQVNALSQWIIGIYLHEFTNNEREIFIVSERMQLNPDNSRTMSVLTFLLFKLNTLQTEIVKLWVSRSHGVMTVVYCLVITQCHVVQINQSENRNPYSVWNLNNNLDYTIHCIWNISMWFTRS